eukprot:m.644880 g.644880  ORF g.644880 m.644880 type:complete len:162 (+) comp58352_c0_seq36:3044-3529(+)
MTPALRVFALVAVCIGCTLAITCEEICPEPAADEAVCGEGETFGSACIANCLEVTEFTAGACGGDSSTTTSTTTPTTTLACGPNTELIAGSLCACTPGNVCLGKLSSLGVVPKVWQQPFRLASSQARQAASFSIVPRNTICLTFVPPASAGRPLPAKTAVS